MHPLALLLFAACLPFVWLLDWTALDEYMNKCDSEYQYTLKKNNSMYVTATAYTLQMTSQKWLDESEVDKPVWEHQLIIFVPARTFFKKPSCLLIIDPGQMDKLTSSSIFSEMELASLATKSRSVVALLRPVPIQPLTFYKHPLGWENITGYDIMAYSWWRFMNDSATPPHWLAQFPMVKAAVKAMDTIKNFMKKQGYKDIQNFTLTGIASGGWVSWLTAAVDRRVVAIIPIAMDLLNLTKNFQHLYYAYCGWSYMLRPFYDMNITQRINHPRFTELASHVDPLAYNERYKNVSKYIIVITGDGVNQPDNSHYYYSQLAGEKHLYIIPNVDYRFQGSKTLFNPMLAYYSRIIKNKTISRVSWKFTVTNTTASITVRALNIYRAYSYQADTVYGNRRDFRMKVPDDNSTRNNPIKWIKSELHEVNYSHIYQKQLEIPAKGWRAFFIQALHTNDEHGLHLNSSSEILIIPDSFPCSGCRGTLV